MNEDTGNLAKLPAVTAGTLPLIQSVRPSVRRTRSSRLYVYTTAEIFEATGADRENGQLNAKMNAFLDVTYGAGGRDRLQERLQAARLRRDEAELEVRALEAQLRAVEAAQTRAAEVKAAEDRFRERVRLAKAQGVNWERWLHGGRPDIRLFGLDRARQIVREETA